MLAAFAVIIFVLALGYAGLRDLMSYEIPNWVSLVVVAAFLVMALANSVDLATVGWHLSAGGVVLIVGAVLFYTGVFGGGDAKLLAASAVWFGWPKLLPFFLEVAIVGGVLALIILCLRRFRLPVSWAEKAWLQRLCGGEKGIPYGVAIALGGILVLRGVPLGTLV
ncbi:MAG: prepilin peptidase [Alphaproteobacteria bacterium]